MVHAPQAPWSQPFGTREIERFAQGIKQGCARIQLKAPYIAVDGQRFSDICIATAL
jgi:hypothetical protein